MKTILEINSTNYASTGNIMLDIAKSAREAGFDVYTACKASKESFKHINENQIIIGTRVERIISSYLCTLTGLRDHFNIIGTYSFIKKIEKLKPDLIHLHTLHDDFINLKILFSYLSKANIPVVWTFHDCHAITGKCPAFDMINCNKWKNGCNHCPQLHTGSTNSLIFDTTNKIWNEKKKMFSSVSKMTIVTPSNWLSNIVKESYLSNCNIEVINNGIDLNIFKPSKSDFKKQFGIENKYVVLGVSNSWKKAKGLYTIIELSKILDNNYQIVLVGTNNKVDKILPSNIISIHRTYKKEELVDIYSAADVFVNPTLEDNFPTVNIEAIACGTPVITYNTGGSPETLNSECGKVINKNDIDSLVNSIKNIVKNNACNRDNCLSHAKLFDKNIKYTEYIKLYKKLIS